MSTVVADAPRSAGILGVHGLQKRYGATTALAGVDLHVEPGSIYGLVGLNGAGKTTTLECVLGLERPDAGELTLFGEPVHGLRRADARLAAVFDEPCLRRALRLEAELQHAWLLCDRQGRTPDEVLELLGLGGERRKRTGKLSLGNRRRASIARALLGNPQLVVLDEPFSGLDPQGSEDLLGVLTELAARGVTFVVSSHQLSLMERLCTHFGILHHGRMILESDRATLLGDGDNAPSLTLRVTPRTAALEVLRAGLGCTAAEGPGSDAVQVTANGVSAAQLNRALVEAGVEVHELRPSAPSLDALFRERIAGSHAP